MQGSVYGGGNVFSMTPAGALTNIYSFCMQPGCSDGFYPGSGVILGSDGDFYGTTPAGGNSNSQGTIFKLTQSGKLTTLYDFCSLSACSDGGAVVTGLTQASNGNLYGATALGGANGEGVLFEITPAGKYRVLYSFCSQQNCADGSEPETPIQAINGNFYGNAYTGGSHGYGAVYEITAAGSHKVLYNFCSRTACSDGANPNLLLQDSAGNFYGTTNGGGSAKGYGAVFKITPKNQYVVLHTFELSDGAYPTSLILANDGNLYGTTISGGSGGGGNIFQITPAGVFTSLYSFCSSGGNCAQTGPVGLIQGTDGVLYGSSLATAENLNGTIFSLSNALGPLIKTVPIAGKIGARVIILGNNLTGSTSVTFSGVAAAFTVESDTYIKATVPAGATTGTVSVVTPSGTVKSNPQFVVVK
jgi:uncharacterized repeat protein (TIGR03803 family)